MRVIALLCLVVTAAAGECTSPAAVVNQPFFRELLEVRLELYRQGLELQDWKLRQLDNEMEQARAEQGRLEREEQALRDEVASPEGEEGEVGSRRAETTGVELPRLRQSRQANAQRITELTSQSSRERARQKTLIQLAEQAAACLRDTQRKP